MRTEEVDWLWWKDFFVFLFSFWISSIRISVGKIFRVFLERWEGICYTLTLIFNRFMCCRYLTMDQYRKVIFLLESDPKVLTVPIIGMWVLSSELMTAITLCCVIRQFVLICCNWLNHFQIDYNQLESTRLNSTTRHMQKQSVLLNIGDIIILYYYVVTFERLELNSFARTFEWSELEFEHFDQVCN